MAWATESYRPLSGELAWIPQIATAGAAGARKGYEAGYGGYRHPGDYGLAPKFACKQGHRAEFPLPPGTLEPETVRCNAGPGTLGAETVQPTPRSGTLEEETVSEFQFDAAPSARSEHRQHYQPRGPSSLGPMGASPLLPRLISLTASRSTPAANASSIIERPSLCVKAHRS